MSKKEKDSSNGDGPPDPPNRPGPSGSGPGNQRYVIWIVIAGLLLAWMLSSQDSFWGGSPTVSYSTFRQQLTQDNIAQVTVQGPTIEGELKQEAALKSAEGDTASYSTFTTYLPSFGDEELLSMLEEHNVKVSTLPESTFNWWTVLLWGIPLFFLLLIGFQFFRQMRMQGQNMFKIGQSKAKLQDAEMVDTDFEDIAGLEGAKTELKEIISFLKNPDQFETLGGEIPRGVLLVGPPGTGKTLLARAVAGEAGVPYFTITGSDFMEMFVGVGAKRVRDMFDKAKKKSPSIIFIDELDSIGRKRGAGLGGGHDEREQTLNQMLSELDGFEPNQGVVVMAATNRPDILDPALLRPGRFDRQITVHLPTQQHREEILKIHARDKKIAEEVDLKEIARSTPGFSGADLRNLLNEAALIAARYKRKAVEQKDIDQARDKVMMGLKREGVNLSDHEKEMLAYHEAGHAVVAAVLPNADPLHKVTVIPRGKAMGVTQQLPEREKLLYEKKYMLDRMAVMMGGRAAENLIFDTATSGAENDLKQITKLARKMVLDWGMSEKFGNMAFGGENQQVFLGDELGSQRDYSDSTAREIDQEVKQILKQAYDRALTTLEENRDILEKLAEELLEKEEVTGDTIMSWFRENGRPQKEGSAKETEDTADTGPVDGPDNQTDAFTDGAGDETPGSSEQGH
ncbi:MAG: ATP-dependent zinc metalloprotease FtsH [Balneolaceae bacterium]|nr:ATP-dependent zinc metalloprotease FtsH [Balneolaceae bacterium]